MKPTIPCTGAPSRILERSAITNYEDQRVTKTHSACGAPVASVGLFYLDPEDLKLERIEEPTNDKHD